MAIPNPLTLVLLQGMSSKSNVYDPLKQELTTKHNIHNIQTIELPSAEAFEKNLDLSPTPLEADTRAIRAILTSIIEKDGHDVLLVAHSYAGTPALHSTHNLWKHRRGPNGITKVLLLCSSLSLPGQSVAGVRMSWAAANPGGGIKDDLGVSIEEHNGLPFVVPKAELWPAWFNDLPPDQQRFWGEKAMVPSALGAVASPVPEGGEGVGDPREWRVAYLLCEELDLAMPRAFQEYLVEKAREAEAQVEVKRIRSGHFVQISHAPEVAEWIVSYAKE